jgi:hypothetical protein
LQKTRRLSIRGFGNWQLPVVTRPLRIDASDKNLSAFEFR